jgi:hypothetical protein
MVADTDNNYDVDSIIDYLKSKSVSCEIDFEETYYYGGSKDITTVNTSIGRIRFTENPYNNFVSMYYKGKHYESYDVCLKELDNHIP